MRARTRSHTGPQEDVALTIRNLEFVLHPRSIAVFGASTRRGSVGAVVIENIVQGGFEGSISTRSMVRQQAGLAIEPPKTLPRRPISVRS